MDRLDALRTLIAVADRRSFSGAARRLHISPTVASRAVSAIEDELGVVLFNRTTRSVTLTAEGSAYVQRCRDALYTLDDAKRDLQGGRSEPSGLLVIGAPVVFGRLHVLPMVSQLLRWHPRLRVRLTLSDHIAKLSEEGIDVAVRAGELSDSALHAVKLTEVNRIPVASPDYIERRGMPETPADLPAHDIIGFDSFALGDEWRFGADRSIVVRFTPKLVTNSVEAAIDAATLGLGIARPLSYQVAKPLGAGSLVSLLSAYDPPPTPINLVYLANRKTAPNIRALIETAQSYVRENLS